MINDTILQSFKDKRVLVTGGTGLIGRQVVSILCDAGARLMSGTSIPVGGGESRSF